MSDQRLGFWARLGMFFWLPWKILFQGESAFRVRQALQEPPKALPPEKKEEAAAGPDPSLALHLLSVLQRDGRLVDFLQEDIASATDAQVGAAARVVHEGCKKALDAYLTLAPLRQEEEGAEITVQEGFDPSEIRLAGNLVGSPPFRGRLVHAGWKVEDVRLPTLTREVDATVIAPAEVEL